MTRTGSVNDIIKTGWGFYGYPGSPNRPVGEVGYVVDWHADQMTRLDWDVFIDGSDDWVVTLPKNEDAEEGEEPERISTTRTVTDADGKQVQEQDQTAASMELLELIEWDEENVRAVDTNLFVAGMFDYANFGKNGWRVVSSIEPKRKETLKDATDVVSFIRPHPANPKVPNPPLARILDLLESLEWLTRQSSTQSKQRVLMNGVILTADGFTGPPDGNGNRPSFWEMWNETLSARQVDPDDMSPVRLEGPADLVQNGVKWVLPPFGYDEVLDRKITAAIERLAWGLPVPPEILLGMQAQSRATAFQVEENAYRAHIEPPALQVAGVAEKALNKLLPDVTVRVVPNPARLLARKNSVEDIKWARENGLVDPTYTREVLGIPEDAAPDPEVDGIPIKVPSAIERDPANVAADPPVTAAANTGPDLSTLLADIDAALSSELAGATVAATDWARRRLGAQARTVEAVRNNGARDMTNDQLAVHLGFNGLTAAGVNVPDRIAEPVDAATKWWVKRVGQAWEQAATLVPGWSGQGDWVSDSVDVLATSLASHITDTLTDSDPGPLDAESIRRVVDAAAGGN